MQIVAESRFRQLRESLYASREDVIRRTKSVSIGTLRNAEMGKPVRNQTARQLHEAINALLSEAGKPTVAMDDLRLIAKL
jgi:hypothetical protein